MLDVQQNGGIHAPEDRSLPARMINFAITADSPEGPWSDPHIIDGAVGIDPDIFLTMTGGSGI